MKSMNLSIGVILQTSFWCNQSVNYFSILSSKVPGLTKPKFARFVSAVFSKPDYLLLFLKALVSQNSLCFCMVFDFML